MAGGLAVGDCLTLDIDSLAFGGDGVGRYEQLTVFVPDVCPGERVTVTVTDVRPRFVRAAVQTIERAAPERVPALCELSGVCGGCLLQHLDYPAQVAAKTRMVSETLARLGKLPDVPVADCVPSPVPYGYRNKIELTCFGDEDGVPYLCYHQRDPSALVAVDHCPLALPEVNSLLERVTAWLRAGDWPAYNPATGEGLVREIGLRYSTSCREATVELVTGRRELPNKMPRLDALRTDYKQLVGLRHTARTRASQSLIGRAVGDLLGRPLRFKVGDLSLRVSPEVFFQVNDLLLEPLALAVRDAVAPAKGDHVLDLYGGVGTFGLLLAREVAKVTNLEIDSTAAQDARSNARFNGLDNVEVVRGQTEQKLPDLLRDGPVHKVVLDPPRRGCGEGVIAVLARTRPRRIAYVSCDPSTLARDLQRFAAHGYQTTHVQPFDLFPHTGHIEAVATLEPAR